MWGMIRLTVNRHDCQQHRCVKLLFRAIICKTSGFLRRFECLFGREREFSPTRTQVALDPIRHAERMT